MTTRGQKIFVAGVELTKLLPIEKFRLDVDANDVAQGTITFFVEEVSMDSDGNIVIGKTDTKELEKLNNVKFERELIF